MMILTEKNLDISWAKDISDKHISAIMKIAKLLVKKLPYCGIGISGSVGKLNHKETSDVDLLVIDNSFIRIRQCVFLNYLGISINVFCISPELVDKRLPEWTINFIGQQINYFNDTQIIYDPSNLISALKQKAAHSVYLVTSSDKILKDKCYINIEELLAKLKFGESLQTKFNLLFYILNLWFLKNGIKLPSKQNHLHSFELIKENDPEFYKLLYDVHFTDTQVNLLEIQKFIRHLNV